MKARDEIQRKQQGRQWIFRVYFYPLTIANVEGSLHYSYTFLGISLVESNRLEILFIYKIWFSRGAVSLCQNNTVLRKSERFKHSKKLMMNYLNKFIKHIKSLRVVIVGIFFV